MNDKEIIEDSKIEMTPYQNSQPAFVNLKREFKNGAFINLANRNATSNSIFSGTWDHSTQRTNENQISIRNYIGRNRMNRIERTVYLDEED